MKMTKMPPAAPSSNCHRGRIPRSALFRSTTLRRRHAGFAFFIAFAAAAAAAVSPRLQPLPLGATAVVVVASASSLFVRSNAQSDGRDDRLSRLRTDLENLASVLRESSSSSSSSDAVDPLLDAVESIDARRADLADRTAALDRRLQSWLSSSPSSSLTSNGWSDLASALNETLHGELRRRDKSERDAAESKRRRDLDRRGRVSHEELGGVLRPSGTVSPVEEELVGWAASVAMDEVRRAAEAERDGVDARERARQERLEGEEEEEKRGIPMAADGDYGSSCVDVEEATALVQGSLTAYDLDGGVGLKDHAALTTNKKKQTGGSIVHSMTSETYRPSALDNDAENDVPKLGYSAWSRYIPQDWERLLLPTGWESMTWPELTDRLAPLHLRHSLGVAVRGLGSTVPPDVVLMDREGAVQLGSCWPMEGSNGRITVRLPYPLRVGAVTIDHFPFPSTVGTGGGGSSAPRHFQILGYPPCREGGGGDCNKLGFDVAREFDLGSFEYVLVGADDGTATQGENAADEEQSGNDAASGGGTGTRPSVQTFVVRGASHQVGKEVDVVVEDDGGDDSADPMQCSAVTMTCGAGEGDEVATSDDANVAMGVTLVVDDNWGNNDYTCLYRFRIHGEPVAS